MHHDQSATVALADSLGGQVISRSIGTRAIDDEHAFRLSFECLRLEEIRDLDAELEFDADTEELLEIFAV